MAPEEHADGAKEAAKADMTEKVSEEDAPDPDEGDLDDLDGGLTPLRYCNLCLSSLTQVLVDRYAR